MGAMDREVMRISAEQETAMFDQPADGQLDFSAAVKPAAKPSKKHKRKGRALRDMAYETLTPAQVIMRDEMARGVHQPEPLADVLKIAFGQPGPFAEQAVEIIQQGPSLTLQTSQWIIVQELVERGIKAGYDLAKREPFARGSGVASS